MPIKKFGDVVVGDVLDSPNGPVMVARVHEKHIPERMYRLEFENGKSIEASGNHLWYVETSVDKSLHRGRVKTARKLLKNMRRPVFEELFRLANSEEVIEASLSDMITLVNVEEKEAIKDVVIRVAESIGHITEDITTYEDLYNGTPLHSTTVRAYDARRFSQQLLSLYDKRFVKRWPILVGRVVTTETLSMMEVDVDVPELRS